VEKNTCYLSIGTSRDTDEFVADNIDYHWNMSIKEHYPDAKKMLILAMVEAVIIAIIML